MSMLALSSAGGSVPKIYVEDVFSTYLYTGNGATQTITNGIDLAGKGGMVWFKSRTIAFSHWLVDTVQGRGKGLSSNNTSKPTPPNDGTLLDTTELTSFNSNGFSLGTSSNWGLNAIGATPPHNLVSYTFRKAPKFFDIVTYTGNGVAGRQIPHNLGCEVGMIIVKRLDSAGGWSVYHKSLGSGYAVNLDLTYEKSTANSWNNSTPTSSVFYLGDNVVNGNGATYVAYLFANDPSADGIIQCGSFTTDASGNATVNLGWEPQCILSKSSTTAGTNWNINDLMRGLPVGSNPATLFPNLGNAEGASSAQIALTPTGFVTSGGWVPSSTYIYLAIRRPMKTPTSGTQVYNAIVRTGTSVDATVSGVGFEPDFVHIKANQFSGFEPSFTSRITNKSMRTSDTTVERDLGVSFDVMNGIKLSGVTTTNYSGQTFVNHFFKRAKGFFDVVCYTGNGVARTVNHNLGVVPELMWVKSRSGAYAWCVYHSTIGNTKAVFLNSTGIPFTEGSAWNNTTPTSSLFTVGGMDNTNLTSATFVAYLFATCPGVSKVDSYTGNGSSQTINCGFSAGARFILIKRTDSTGDWYIWDNTRGIIAANDPHLSLNTTAAEVTTDDSIDPNAVGFDVVQNSATNINVNGASYIFLAVS